MADRIYLDKDFDLSNNLIESLVVLYQPVFSFNALNLYLTLYQYADIDMHLDVNGLSRILNEPVDEVMLMREELERFNLIQTFFELDYYIVLKKPLSPHDFISHPMFGRLYAIVCGQDQYKNMILKYHKKPFTKRGEDISKAFDGNRLSVWNENLEEKFEKVQTVESKKPFDVDFFFKQIPDALYPVHLRTMELRDLISEVGSLYKVDYMSMRRFLMDNTNFEKETFNTRGFVFQVEKEFGRATVSGDNPYDVDPVSFIRFKQGYDYVVDADRNLVNSLRHNFKFSDEVINVLIEFVLDHNNMNLSRAYVEKIASTWKRNNVETLEDAKKQIEKPISESKKSNVRNKKEAPMPVYRKESEQDKEMLEKLREEAKALLKRGEADGT